MVKMQDDCATLNYECSLCDTATLAEDQGIISSTEFETLKRQQKLEQEKQEREKIEKFVNDNYERCFEKLKSHLNTGYTRVEFEREMFSSGKKELFQARFDKDPRIIDKGWKIKVNGYKWIDAVPAKIEKIENIKKTEKTDKLKMVETTKRGFFSKLFGI